MTEVIPSQLISSIINACHLNSLKFNGGISPLKVLLLLLQKCSHLLWIAWDSLFVMSSVTGNLCNKCPKQLVEQNSSYSDYFNVISGFTSNTRAPGGPVTLFNVNSIPSSQTTCVSYVLIGDTEGGITETIPFAPDYQFEK